MTFFGLRFMDDLTVLIQVLGDLVESCVGAILLDTGFDLRRVWEIALSFFDRILSFSSMQINPTRELRELCQTNSLVLKFTALKKGGTFSVDAEVKGESFSIPASASNINKEAAKRMAAKELYSKLKVNVSIFFYIFLLLLFFIKINSNSPPPGHPHTPHAQGRWWW